MLRLLTFLIVPLLIIGIIAAGKLGNPDGGFAYAMPAGYREQPAPTGAKALYRRDTPNGAIGCSLSAQLNPVFYVTWNSFLDDAGAQVMSKITRETEAQMPGTNVLGHRILKAGELPILAYDYAIPDGPNGRRVGSGQAYFFIAGATQYNISCGAPLADEAAMKADMAALLRSFRFKE